MCAVHVLLKVVAAEAPRGFKVCGAEQAVAGEVALLVYLLLLSELSRAIVRSLAVVAN